VSVRTPVVELFTATELGNTSYLVADPDSGEALVIDPFRDIDQYLTFAEKSGFKLARSLETHVHNDFVSGSRELEKEAGAAIGAAADSGLDFAFERLRDKQEVPLGRWCMRVRHTPGHTATHLSYELSEDGRPVALFSGGALMVGSVARTDLFGPQHAAVLAHEAFRTLRERLADLPDEVGVYPTHGAGSFCGTGASDKRVTTLGAERMTNPLFQDAELLPFLARVLNQQPYPSYYNLMAALNRRGAPLAGRHLPPLKRLSAAEVREHIDRGSAVIDIRLPPEYDHAHIPGSYNVSLEDQPFSAWVGWIMEPERPIVLTGGTAAQRAEARRQLFRIGFDNIVGEFDSGVAGWQDAGHAVSSFETGDVDLLAGWLERAEEPLTILDVRDGDEWAHGHLPGAVHLTVPEVQQNPHALPDDAPVAVHCASGFRAGIAASILEQAGIPRIIRIEGGYPDWEARHLPSIKPG
jgi:hydroxyacylglutathione hydrolase